MDKYTRYLHEFETSLRRFELAEDVYHRTEADPTANTYQRTRAGRRCEYLRDRALLYGVAAILETHRSDAGGKNPVA